MCSSPLSDFEEKLVNLIRDYEHLYNPSCPDYSRSDVADCSWSEIAEKLRVNARICKETFTLLRKRFSRLRKEFKGEKAPSGSAATKAKKKAYETFKLLEFLDPFIKERSRTSNIKIEEKTATSSGRSTPTGVAGAGQVFPGEEEASATEDSETASEFAAETSKKRRKHSKPFGCLDLVDQKILEMASKAAEESDEDFVFAKSIGLSLKSLNNQQKALAKLRIQGVLYEIQFGNFTQAEAVNRSAEFRLLPPLQLQLPSEPPPGGSSVQ